MCHGGQSAASSAPEPLCAEDEDVVELGEVTRAQRDAEGIASAIELDGDESPADESYDSEEEAVMGGAASTSPLPIGSQLEFSQDFE